MVKKAIVLSDCPSPLVVCLDMENSKMLTTYLRQSDEWMREAWMRCGPLGER